MERRDGEKCLQRPLEEGREGQPPSRSKVVDAGVSKAQRRKDTAKTHLKVVPVHRVRGPETHFRPNIQRD